MTPPVDMTPRDRCEHTIRHLFTGAIARFIRANPDLSNDEKRLEAATYDFVKLMDSVTSALDGYAIEDLGGKTP